MVLARDKRKRDDTGDVHLRTENVHVEAELDADGLDVLKTFLVVGTGAADPDLDVVLDEERSDLAQSADDTLESGSDLYKLLAADCAESNWQITYVGEVCNTATNEENLALSVHGCAEHEVEDSAGVVEGLGLGGSTRVLAVVGKLGGEASRGDSVGVDNGSTTTSNESPDATSAVENGELEGSTSLCVHLSNVCLLLAHLTTERCGELHGRASVNVDLAVLGGTSGNAEGGRRAGNGPLDTTLELGSLVNLGGKIEEVDIGGGDLLVGDDDERVDLEVSELAVDVDGVQAGNEVDKDVVNTGGHLAEEALGDLLVAGVLLEVDGNQELLSLCVNITNLNTTLVVEENPVALDFELAELMCFVWRIAMKFQN